MGAINVASKPSLFDPVEQGHNFTLLGTIDIHDYEINALDARAVADAHHEFYPGEERTPVFFVSALVLLEVSAICVRICTLKLLAEFGLDSSSLSPPDRTTGVVKKYVGGEWPLIVLEWLGLRNAVGVLDELS